MKISKYFFSTPLFIALDLFAQQPAWELVRQDFWGKIAIDPTNSNIIYVSPGHVPEFGLHKSTDGGKTWTNYQQGYEGMGDPINGIVIDPKNPQRLWIYGGPFKGVARSENGGVTAVKSDTGIYVDHHGYNVCAFAYDSKRDILYAGDFSAGGIYRSFNGGRSWQLVLPYGGGLGFNPLYFMVEEDSGWVYSGTWAHGLWRSKNYGVTWAPLDPNVLGGQPLGEPISFIAKVPNSRTLYATATNGKIFKSYDLGENWSFIIDITNDFDRLDGGLVISSLDTNYIYAGGRPGIFPSGIGGFYLSRNGGKSWQLYHNGLPQYDLYNYNVWSLSQSPDAKYIYVSIHSVFDSIYRLPQGMLTSIQETPSLSPPENFYFFQNYPNPFNAQTKIEFSMARKELISLDVCNLTGEHVVRLVDGKVNVGKQSIVWNGKNSKGGDVSSGIYIIHLKAGEKVLIRKMLLIR
jgi:photosystem II stability/assembly factor-like uncharacterized protein